MANRISGGGMVYPLVFRGGRIVACDDNGTVVNADLAVVDGKIAAIGADLEGQVQIDCRDRWLLPGFVQTHVHLVQTLFRDLAADLELMDWLRTRTWPFERAHDPSTTRDAARLGIAELLASGTTSILDMATVHHTDEVFRAAAEAGIRMTCGKAQMDRDNEAGLGEDTDTSLRNACDLADRWHGKGMLRYAFAPRFVPSCTDELLRESAVEARRRGCMIHTHASENRGEVELVRALTGRDNVEHLDALGLTGPDVALAHCIHLTGSEEDLLARTGTRVVHCPSSNFKLASGIARIPELIAKGVHISLGADGAPCNNRLDMFAEMRLAALMQKPRLGATALPATKVLRMATALGAEALNLHAGELEVGKFADIQVIRPTPWSGGETHAAMVYTFDARAVESVWVGGVKVAAHGRCLAWDEGELRASCSRSLARLRARTGI